MSKHRAGLYNPCYGVFGGAGLAQLYEATDEQKERWLYPTLRGEKMGCFALTEPSGGSDPRPGHPHARLQGRRRVGAERLEAVHLRCRQGRLRAAVRPHIGRSGAQRG